MLSGGVFEFHHELGSASWKTKISVPGLLSRMMGLPQYRERHPIVLDPKEYFAHAGQRGREQTGDDGNGRAHRRRRMCISKTTRQFAPLPNVSNNMLKTFRATLRADF